MTKRRKDHDFHIGQEEGGVTIEEKDQQEHATKAKTSAAASRFPI